MEALEKYWFEESGKASAKALFDTVRELRTLQSYKDINEIEWYKLYSNQALGSFSIDKYAGQTGTGGISFNVIQAITDMITAKIGKNKPKITYLTDDGDWNLHLRAKKLDKFVEGEFYNTKLFDIMPRVLKVGCVFGSGFIKALEKDKRPHCERVLPNEIVVDDREVFNNDPENMYQETYISKFVLKQLYPKFEKEIEAAAGSSKYSAVSVSGFYPNHLIKVIEGWHLPSAKDAMDGKHMIAIENCALFEETWEKNYFPFGKVDFSDRIVGYWGIGIPELLRGIQVNMNRILLRITKSIDLGSVHRVWLEYMSGVNQSQITNETGSIGYYRGQPPIFSTPSVVSGEVFNQLDRLYNRAFEVVGASQLSVSSQKPAGLNAMVAIREYHDIETERFSMVQGSYDNAFMKMADCYVDILDDLERKYPGYSVKIKTDDGIENIRWKDVRVDKDHRMIQKYPTNLLPNQPTGRLDKVIELTQSGFFSKEEAISLLDYPDIKAITSLKTAKMDNIMLAIAKMINDGEKIVPSVYDDLQTGIEMMHSSYLKYRYKGVPQKNLNLLLEWIDQAAKIIEEQMAKAAQEQAMAAPPAPTGLVPPAPQEGGLPPVEPIGTEIENFGQPEMV